MSAATESPFQGILLEGPRIGEYWRYDNRDLDVIFSGPQNSLTVDRVAGSSVAIREKEWSRCGKSIDSLNTPGRPVRREPNVFPGRRIVTYGKEWEKASCWWGRSSATL